MRFFLNAHPIIIAVCVIIIWSFLYIVNATLTSFHSKLRKFKDFEHHEKYMNVLGSTYV